MSLYQRINFVMQMNAAKVKVAQILLETPIRSSTWYIRDSRIDRSVALHQFIDILASRRGFGASGARDTIYAHLGLIDTPIIKVHYEKTIPHVIQEVVKTYVKAKKFEIFAHIEDIDLENRRPGLASWAVDWGVRQDNIRHLNLTRLGVAFSVYGHVDPVLSSKLKCRFDGSVLRAKAHYVASVHMLSDTLDTTSYISFPNDIERGATSRPNTAFTDESRINEIYTLEWLKSQLRNYPELASVVNDRFIAETSLIAQFLERVVGSRLSGQSIVDGRRLACLSSQEEIVQWLALVPASTKIGDCVCFFVGYTEPFVFRGMETVERAETLSLNVNMSVASRSYVNHRISQI
jgi:hypothetical protein